MSKRITSDGKNIKIQTDGVVQDISQGKYHTTSGITTSSHNQNGTRESGTTRNTEYTGNSQEVCAGRGVTSEYNLKICGTPELFSGQAQRTADAAVAKLTGLSLQSGDNRHSQAPSGIPMPDFTKVVTSMTSSLQNTLQPNLPEIARLADFPVFFAKLGAWFASLSAANLAEGAARAAALEIDRQIEQTKIAVEAKMKAMGESPEKIANAITEALSGGGSSPTAPATEDNEGVAYNITRRDVYDAYVENIDTILAAQKQIC